MLFIISKGSAVTERRLVYAGVAGPLVAACPLLYARGSAEARRDFWRRIYEVERLRPT